MEEMKLEAIVVKDGLEMRCEMPKEKMKQKTIVVKVRLGTKQEEKIEADVYKFVNLIDLNRKEQQVVKNLQTNEREEPEKKTLLKKGRGKDKLSQTSRVGEPDE